MPLFENLDFLNINSLRNYPLKEGVSKTDTSGAFVIPDDFMVDLVVSVSSDPSVRVYVSRIINRPDEIQVELTQSNSVNAIGVFVIPTTGHTRYDTYFLIPSASSVNSAGKLVIADLTSLQTLPYGSFSFTLATAEVEARTVLPGMASVSRLVFNNADGTSYSVSGEVNVLAQSNTRFRLINSTTVGIDAGEGLGLNSPCADERPCLKTINGVGPDVNGNFWLTVSECASLTPISNSTMSGLNLSDSCCKPCLSCNEIGDLTERLMQLESDLLSIRNHYNDVSLITSQFGNLSNASCECS